MTTAFPPLRRAISGFARSGSMAGLRAALSASLASLLLAGLLMAPSAGLQAQTPASVASAPALTRPLKTDPGAPPESILWVGNSFFYYNNSMHNHLGRLVASGGARVRATSVTISGSGLDWHDLESLLRPGGLGRYSFVGDNEVRFNKPGRQYDTVLMMDCSQCPIHPELQGAFHATVRRNAELLAKAGARPALFMSWAYKDKPEMTAALAEQYTLAGNANGAVVVPAGLAFARAIARLPGLELYEDDKRHPSLPGTYLAACTVYATLYQKSPQGLGYTAGLKPDLAAQLQVIAWETVQAYQGR